MKIMKYSKVMLVMMMIFPWLTVPLLGRRAFLRFLPGGIFISILVRIVNMIAKKRKWWWWYETLHSEVSGVIPFMLGPFLVGSMWILKWTHGKFLRYLTLNVMVDALFTYIIVPYLTKFGIASLVRMSKVQLMYVFTVLSVLLYYFQYLKEAILGRKIGELSRKNDG